MPKYAQGTSVSVSKSVGEIIKLVEKYGATKAGHMNLPGMACIIFEIHGVPYRTSIPMPSIDDREWKRTPTGQVRSEATAKTMFEKEVARRWRALVVVLKAKFVAIDEGITTIEAEFIGNVMLPGGRTVSEQYSEDLPALAASGAIHPLALPGVSQ